MHAHRQSAVDALGGADQLQPEAELARVLEVVGGDALDALVADLVEVDRRVERQPREDRHLRRGVLAVDVVGRIGLGVAERAAPRPARRRSVAPVRAISLRMKLVVPLTIPWMRSTCAAASDSWSTRITGTTPATAASKRSWTPCSRASRPQLLAVLGEQLLVGGHDVAPGAHRAQHVVARRLDPADHLDDQVAAGEDLLEVAAGARQHAGDLGAQARHALRPGRRARASSSANAAPTVPWPSRPMRKRSASRADQPTSRAPGRRRSRGARRRARRRRGRRSPAAAGCRCSCWPSRSRRRRSPA